MDIASTMAPLTRFSKIFDPEKDYGKYTIAQPLILMYQKTNVPNLWHPHSRAFNDPIKAGSIAPCPRVACDEA